MALITSNGTGGGDFSAGATWVGGAAPGNGDWFTIAATDTVTVDGQYPAAAGQFSGGTSTVDGTLIASRVANSRLTFGANNLVVSATGTLDFGTAASPIPSTITAELYFTPVSEGGTGLDADQVGAQVYFYGAPAYYGSSFVTTLYENVALSAAAGITVKVTGNYKTTYPWAVGQMIVCHKFSSYSTNGNYNDFAYGTITAVGAYDVAGFTPLTVTFTALGIPVAGGFTALAGGYVLNVSRNVIVGKYQAAPDPGPNVTIANRPYIYTPPGDAKSLFSYTQLHGASRIFNTGGAFGVGNAIINSGNLGYTQTSGINITNGCYVGNDTLFVRIMSNSYIHGYWAGLEGASPSLCYFGLYDAWISGEFYGLHYVVGGMNIGIKNANIFSCNRTIGGDSGLVNFGSLYNVKLGYNSTGTNNDNTNDVFFYYPCVDFYCDNCLNPNSESFSNRNTFGYSGRIVLNNDNQVLNAIRIIDAFGTIEKKTADGTGDLPSAGRTAYNDQVLEVTPQSNTTIKSLLSVYGRRENPILVWGTNGVAMNLKLYMQSEYTMTSSEISLFGRYLNGTGGARTEINSTETITDRSGDQSTWDQYLSTGSFTPGADGWVEIWAECYKPGSGANTMFWIDPLLDGVTAGSTVRWEDGYPVIQEPSGTGSGSGVRQPFNPFLIQERVIT